MGAKMMAGQQHLSSFRWAFLLAFVILLQSSQTTLGSAEVSGAVPDPSSSHEQNPGPRPWRQKGAPPSLLEEGVLFGLLRGRALECVLGFGDLVNEVLVNWMDEGRSEGNPRLGLATTASSEAPEEVSEDLRDPGAARIRRLGPGGEQAGNFIEGKVKGLAPLIGTIDDDYPYQCKCDRIPYFDVEFGTCRKDGFTSCAMIQGGTLQRWSPPPRWGLLFLLAVLLFGC